MRLAVLSYAASPLPFYDQWVAEFGNGFLYAINGGSIWEILATPHNEHYLVTTKLLSFAGFSLNGYWDVRFLTVISAFTRAGEAVFLFYLLRSAARTRFSTIIAWLGCMLAFATPISGYNLLSGMQVSFFLAELSLLASLLIVTRWGDDARSGITLCLVHILGLASLASAVFLPVCTLAAALMLPRTLKKFWPVWAVTLALSLAYGLSHAQGHRQFDLSRIQFFLQLVSWPTMSAVPGTLIAGLLLAAVCFRAKLPWRQTTLPVIFGIITFALCSALLLALNRGPAEFHTRHWDSLLFLPLGIVMLCACLAERSGKHRRFMTVLTIASMLVFTVAGYRAVAAQTLPYLAESRAHRTETVLHYRTLLLNGKIYDEAMRINEALQSKNYTFFDDPVDRYIIHPIVATHYVAAPLKAIPLLSPEIIPLRRPSLCARITLIVIDYGVLLLIPALLASYLGLRRLAGANSAPAPA